MEHGAFWLCCVSANSRGVAIGLTFTACVQVICEEEANPYSYGVKKSAKNRYVAGVVTPASPNYMYGLVDDASVMDDREIPQPMLGIAYTKAGYSVRACLQTALARSFAA